MLIQTKTSEEICPDKSNKHTANQVIDSIKSEAITLQISNTFANTYHKHTSLITADVQSNMFYL